MHLTLALSIIFRHRIQAKYIHINLFSLYRIYLHIILISQNYKHFSLSGHKYTAKSNLIKPGLFHSKCKQNMVKFGATPSNASTSVSQMQ